MCRFVSKKYLIIILISILFVSTTLNAQTQEEESSDNQPSYIDELVDNSQLSERKVTQMRNNGESWGNIKLRVQMAERIAANNPDTGKTYEQKYQEALNQVSQQRAAGKGFGDIANENNFRVGDVMGNGNGNATQNQQRNRTMSENQNRTQTQVQVQTRQQTQTQAQTKTQTKAKKKGLFGRFLGIFGIGKKEKKQKSAQAKNALKNDKSQVKANKKQTQNSSNSQNKVQSQRNTTNQVQNRNSSGSQNVRTKQRTQTNQRSRTQSGNSGSGNMYRNQNFGGGAGRTRTGGGGGGRGR